MNPALKTKRERIRLPFKIQKGFTLIELVIVMSIIAIISGVIIAYLHPARQQKRARHTTMRANLDEIQMGLIGCANARLDACSSCNTFAKIGVDDPSGTPGPDYTYSVNCDGTYLTATASDNDPGGACNMTYRYTLADGTISMGTQDPDCLVDFAD
jgi:prepilin-type N-terminal cleavage/methylation domain-containing protein